MQLVSPSNAQPVFSSRAYASPELVPHPLGAIGHDVFGRRYRFAQAGASNLVVGNVLQAAAQIAEHQDMTVLAAAIGDKSIAVTPGATAGAADLYAGGIAVIDTTPGIGYSYPIKGHLAITASTAFRVNLRAGADIVIALTTSSVVSLYANPYKNVIQAPATTLTNVAVGIAQYVIVATEYGWIADSGHFGVLMAASVSAAVGTAVSSPSGTAGAAMENSGVKQIIGTIMDTAQASHVQGVLVRI